MNKRNINIVHIIPKQEILNHIKLCVVTRLEHGRPIKIYDQKGSKEVSQTEHGRPNNA